MIHDCFAKAFIAAVGIVVICAWAPALADCLKIADEIELLAASSSSDTNSIDSTVKTAEKEVEYRIGRIEVRGNRLIAAEKIKSVIKTKEGEVYDREQIARDLRAIFNLGYFESDGVTLTTMPRLTGGNIHLVFQVLEAPVLHDVSFSGSGQIIDAELKSVFEDFVGWPLPQWRLQAGIRKIQEICIARGLEHCFVIPTKTKYVSDPELYAFSDLDRIKSSSFCGQAPVLMRTVLKTPLRSTDSFTLDLLISEQPNSSMKQIPSTDRGITLPSDGHLFGSSSSRPLKIRWKPWPKGL